jgi:YesN/AraC family two-component response regulator
VNAQDYLLKPLKKEELLQAYNKISSQRHPAIREIDYAKLAQAIIQEEQKFERRYLIRFGEQVRSVQSDEIA